MDYKNRIKNIIFDFDGTLADTRNSILLAVKETLKKYGIQEVDEEGVKRAIGLPLKDSFKAYLKDEQLEEAIKEYRSIYDSMALESVTLFPGVKDTLYFLYEKGIKLAVASSKGKEALVNLLTTLDMVQLFSYVVGEQDIANKKPAPDMVNYLLVKMKGSPLDTLVVGDTRFDILMGKAAECLTCAVTYGNHSKEALLSESPSFIVDNFPDIRKIVEKQ